MCLFNICWGKSVPLCAMKYFVIAGESSGDLHARHLMDAIARNDADADVRYWYRPELAYMGFVSVAMHLPEILKGMRECKEEILAFCPDRLVLVDYPGFNLKVASWFHKSFVNGRGGQAIELPQVIYYIPPKIWAWKEGRIAQIRKYVDKVLGILPFEVQWYAEKYDYDVDYVGNPTLDEIDAFKKSLQKGEVEEWSSSLSLGKEPVVAMLPGSRRQEIERNLPMMLRAAMAVGGRYQYVIASAPNMEAEFYEGIVTESIGGAGGDFRNRITLAPCQGSRSSFMLLHNAYAALVTSGTATLETAIMGVPQVVCYAMACGKLVSFLRCLILKVPYVSLVNLIAGHEVVPELVAGEMTDENMEKCLRDILADDGCRKAQSEGYALMMRKLGEPGAPEKAARVIIGKNTNI